MRLDRSVTSRFFPFLAACSEVVRVVWGMLVNSEEKDKEMETEYSKRRNLSKENY